MPEGPEIHREADKIRKAIADQTPIYFYFHHDHLKPFEQELSGKKVLSVEAFGKGLVTSFEGDYHIYSHNQLYGKWFIKPAGEYPETNRELRLEIRTDLKSALLYSASEIDVMDGESLEKHPYLTGLGPDLLKNPEVEMIADRVSEKQFHRRSFASLLLDQGFLAGVGNYLRTEILFDCGIHPSRKPGELNDDQLIRFARSSLTITHRAYRTGGITTEEELVGRLKSNGAKRREYRHYLFGRENRPCHICGEEVIKERMSGRRIYICGKCQV